MAKREYSKCVWCGKTIDVTNNSDELCKACSEFDSKMEMEKAIL